MKQKIKMEKDKNNFCIDGKTEFMTHLGFKMSILWLTEKGFLEKYQILNSKSNGQQLLVIEN